MLGPQAFQLPKMTENPFDSDEINIETPQMLKCVSFPDPPSTDNTLGSDYASSEIVDLVKGIQPAQYDYLAGQRFFKLRQMTGLKNFFYKLF